jgi:sugar/nucleoside kinase (ribokinase family)
MLDKATFLDHLDLFAASRMTVLGYYSLMPSLESDLPEVFTAVREVGCQTALDAAGDGGGLEPLDRILPHLDVFVPSVDEAAHQTGLDDPQQIIEKFRSLGALGMLGLKLGSKGALLSPADGQWIEVDIVTPPGGKVVDTTGAGDCFYAGLLTGLLRGLSADEAGRLAAATGACCVAALGASEGILGYEETAKLAGL